MSFGKRLKALRLKHNMTQEVLAKNVNLSKANISKYEADLVEPSLNTLAMLAVLFDVSIDYLLGISVTSAEKTQSLTELYPDLTEEELKKILEYIEFLKTTRKD